MITEVDGSSQIGSTGQTDRRAKAFSFVDLAGRGLEIGPSYDPLPPKSSGAPIETVDHASRGELIEKFTSYGVPPEVLTSRSWRVTRPLRAPGRAVRGARA